jgi:hypothetical protein
MHTAAIVFSSLLALVCIYWTFDYVRRRSRRPPR